MSSADADKRLTEDGKNNLSEKESLPWYCVFLHELTGFFSLLLWFGGILCFVAYGISVEKEDKSNLYLGVVLVFVVMVTGIFSY
jgi:sodium/potassium-transporting ATPase subunit alpha